MSASASQALLLVDGYNIIGSWLGLQQTRDQVGLDAARDELKATLVDYTAVQGYDTEIIFDSHYQESIGTCEAVTSNLSVRYTNFGQTADTYIEKVCAHFYHEWLKTHPRLIVATSDNAQRLTVIGYGAECMTARQLAVDVELMATKTRRLQQQDGKSGRSRLFNSLSPSAKQRLQSLRFQ